MRANVIWILLATILMVAMGAFADVPSQINFQGTLTDSIGNPIDDNQQMAFAIYADSIGGSPLWSETHTSVDVTDGLFHVVLGSITSLPASIFDDEILWLETIVEADILAPRTKLVTVPYGFKSNTADQATWADSAQHATYSDTANVALETQSISYVDTADYAHEAGYAYEADYAYYADEASYSIEAEHATYADTAQYAAMSMPDADWTVNADTIYHLNGNVGIGTANPNEKLDVNGTVKMTGFQLTGTRSAGDVLTSDANGVGTWQAPTGGGEFSLPYEDSVSTVGYAFSVRNDYSPNGVAIQGEHGPSGNFGCLGYYNRGVYGNSHNGQAVSGSTSGSGFSGYFYGKFYASGDVGIGTETPSCKLHLYEYSGYPKLKIESDDGAPTIDLDGTDAAGVYEIAFKESGTYKSAVGWEAVDDYFYIDEGGVTSLTSKNGNIGIGTSSPTEKLDVNGTVKMTVAQVNGNAYVSGNVGIGTASPTEELDVIGTVKMTGFQLTGSRSAGDVLTSDANGVGAWQPPPAGFSLPYSGSDATNDASFEVTNTSTGGNGVGIKGIGPNSHYGYLGGDSVGVYGNEGSGIYAGYFDGYVKVTDGLSVRDQSNFYYDSMFGRALTVYNDHTDGESFKAYNARGDYVLINEGSNVLYAYNQSGPTATLAADFAAVKGVATAPRHAGHFTGDVYVSSVLGIGTTTPEQQLDVYGDVFIGGGSTAHDGLDEELRIRGMSDEWIIGVTNEASAGATDFYIGTTGEDGKFHMENGGDVGIGTNNPTAKLDVNGDVKLGTNGSIFLEIQEITGTTSASGWSTDISYPAGYTWSNTRVLSLEIHADYAGDFWITMGNTFLSSMPVSCMLYSTYITIRHGDDSSLHNQPFRMVLMKMP